MGMNYHENDPRFSAKIRVQFKEELNSYLCGIHKRRRCEKEAFIIQQEAAGLLPAPAKPPFVNRKH